MRYKEVLGIVLIVTGIFLIIVQPFSPTAAVIDLSNNVSRIWFFIGLGMIIGGILLAKGKIRENIGDLVDRDDLMIIETNRFRKDIKGHSLRQIANAIEKIDTGGSKEEKLKGFDLFSVRAGGKERVVYEKEYHKGQPVVTLKRYLSDHDYDKLYR